MALKSVSFASETSTGVSITPDEYSIYCRDSSYRYISTYSYDQHLTTGKIYIEFGADKNYSSTMGLYNLVYIKDSEKIISGIEDYDIKDKTVIGILIDLDASTITYWRDNQLYKTDNVNFTNKKISITVGIARDCRLFFNFGQQSFIYPPSEPYITLSYFYNSCKFLIKQGIFYYSILPDYYEPAAKTFIPLTLAGGVLPNAEDINLYGFDDINDLHQDITVGDETFKPIDKLFDEFEIRYIN